MFIGAFKQKHLYENNYIYYKLSKFDSGSKMWMLHEIPFVVA